MNDAKKPDKFKAGATSIKAADLNALANAVPGLITSGRGIHITKQGNRYIISLADAQGGASGLSGLATITDIRDTYLLCEKDGAPITVAKPWALRNGVVWPAGATYEYTGAGSRIATGSSGTEQQRLTPDYEVGEELLVERLPSARITDDDGAPIVYVDKNNAGRCWAEVPE